MAYSLEEYKFIEKCIEEGKEKLQVQREWPWDNPPGYGSIKRAYTTVRGMGAEDAFYHKPVRKAWTEQEDKQLIELYYELDGGSVECQYQYYKRYGVRTPGAVNNRLEYLLASDKMENLNPNKNNYASVDYHAKAKENNITILSEARVGSHSKVLVRFEECGHTVESRLYGIEKAKCPVCNSKTNLFNRESLSKELRESPAIVYCVKFEDAFKVGITGRTTKERGAGFPKFDILKEIHTTLYEALRIEETAHDCAPRLPMYEPLLKNGGTECFELQYLTEVLYLLDNEEINLPNHKKNNT